MRESETLLTIAKAEKKVRSQPTRARFIDKVLIWHSSGTEINHSKDAIALIYEK